MDSFTHSEAGPVVIFAEQICLQSRNWKDLPVQSFQSHVQRNMAVSVTRIVGRYLFLRVQYGARLATTKGVNFRETGATGPSSYRGRVDTEHMVNQG